MKDAISRDMLESWLKKNGWIKVSTNAWQLEVGPNRYLTCSHLGSAVEVQLEKEEGKDV